MILKEIHSAIDNTMAVILAGRRGYELKDLTENRAIAAIPVAGKFKMVDFSLSNCVNSGIRRIGVSTKGSADVLHQNLGIINDNHPKYVLLVEGYHLCKQDYRVMLSEHIERGADVSVACVNVSMQEAQSMGTVVADEYARISDYQNSPKVPPVISGTNDRCLASMGVYIFNFDYIKAKLSESSYKDIGKDLISQVVGIN